MVEAMAVITAVSGTISTINTVKGWLADLQRFVREYRLAGSNIQKLFLSLQTLQTDLGLWMELWDLQQTTSRRFQAELWGNSHLNTMIELYVFIKGSIDEIRRDLAAALKASDMLRPTPYNKLAVSASLVVDFRKESTEYQKRMSITKTLKFVHEKDAALSKKLLDLKDRLASLRTLSYDAYAAKHRVSLSNALSTEQLKMARTSILLQMALETRPASVGLYQSYLDTCLVGTNDFLSGSDSIRLDLSLVDDKILDLDAAQSRDSMILQYHLLVPWRSKGLNPLEILIEGPFDLGEPLHIETESQPDRGFAEACYAALMNDTSEFRIPCRSEVRRFRSRAESKISSSNPADWKPLPKLLYCLDVPIAAEPALKFPRSQRIYLAYKLAQCGLLISGTSWLSKLGNQLVKRTPRDRSDTYHFILELPTAKDSAAESIIRETPQHLFAIGVILFELGTGRLVNHTAFSRKANDIYPDVFIYEPGQDASTASKYKSANWQSQLTVSMGDNYTNAVKFCLAKKRRNCWRQVRDVDLPLQIRETAYREVLEDYYIEVLRP